MAKIVFISEYVAKNKHVLEAEAIEKAKIKALQPKWISREDALEKQANEILEDALRKAIRNNLSVSYLRRGKSPSSINY
jgi:hypothetical protein